MTDPMPVARASDPLTSHIAAASAIGLQARHQWLILEALREHGPAGKDAIAERCGLDGVQTCRRLSELARMGAIAWTGETVRSKSGRAEREWAAV